MVYNNDKRQSYGDNQGSMSERVVYTRRIAKVVKGGRTLRFNAMVVVGDGAGSVGAGMGKAKAIPDAVRKGSSAAKRNMLHIPLKGSTIPQKTSARFGASLVLIKPAPPGTGLIASGAMRAVLDAAGIKDAVSKSYKSRNPINVIQATIEALSQLKDPQVELAKRLGKPVPLNRDGSE
jgi:small subunit ribosomal protein S5